MSRRIRLSHRILATGAALVLVIGGGLAGPALADDTTETVSPAQTTPADDAPTTTETSPPETTSPETTPPTTPSTTTTTPPTSTSTPPTSTTESTLLPVPYEGILEIRAVDVTTGADVSGVPARFFRPEAVEIGLPASMVLPSGHYRVEILGVPAGYELVSPWHASAVVEVEHTVGVVFQLRPVAGHSSRVPIQSIPSGRTR